jgi:cytochrome c551/c552
VHVATFIHPGTGALVSLSTGTYFTSLHLHPVVLALLLQSGLVDQLFRVVLGLAAIVFLAVEGVLVYAVFRFRQRASSEGEANISPRPGLEILWTLIPAILVIIIAIFSFRALAAQSQSGPNSGGTPQAPDTPAAGRAVFMTYGCSACHTLGAVGADGTVGPSLNSVGSWAGTVVAGMSAAEFLHQSVVDPNAYIAPGYQSGIMPANFAERLSSAQLSGLVNFLLQQK